MILARQLGKTGNGLPVLGMEFTDNDRTLAGSKSTKDIGIYGAAGEVGGGYAFCGETGEGGDGAEIHEIGRAASGEVISSSHITTNALFKFPNRDRTRLIGQMSKLDGPLYFETETEIDWESIHEYMSLMKTHLFCDGTRPHSGPYKGKKNEWVWWSEAPLGLSVPQLDEEESSGSFGTLGDEGIQMSGSRVPQTTSSGRQTPDTNKTSSSSQSGSDSGSAGNGSYNPKNQKPGAPGGFKPEAVPSIREPVDPPEMPPGQEKKRSRNTTPSNGGNPSSSTSFGRRGASNSGGLDVVAGPAMTLGSPHELIFTALLAKPAPSVLDGPNLSDAGFTSMPGQTLAVRRHQRTAPITGRIEAYGGLKDDGVFNFARTFVHYDKSARNAGGTGPGGFIITPPEVNTRSLRRFVDLLGIDPPKTVAGDISATTWINVPNVKYGNGYPDLKTGGVRNGSTAQIDTDGKFSFDVKIASGAEGSVIEFPASPTDPMYLTQNLEIQSGTGGSVELNASGITDDRQYDFPDYSGVIGSGYGKPFNYSYEGPAFGASASGLQVFAIDFDWRGVDASYGLDMKLSLGLGAGVIGQEVTLTFEHGPTSGALTDFSMTIGPTAYDMSGLAEDDWYNIDVLSFFSAPSLVAGHMCRLTVTLGIGFTGTIKSWVVSGAKTV